MEELTNLTVDYWTIPFVLFIRILWKTRIYVLFISSIWAVKKIWFLSICLATLVLCVVTTLTKMLEFHSIDFLVREQEEKDGWKSLDSMKVSWSFSRECAPDKLYYTSFDITNYNSFVVARTSTDFRT